MPKLVIQHIPVFLLFAFSSIIRGQSTEFAVEITDTFRINFNNLYELSALNVIPTSEKVKIGDRILVAEQYILDLKENSISIADTLEYSIFDTLFVSYNSFPLDLRKDYSNRSLVQIFDENINDSVSLVKPTKVDLTTKSILGKDLRSSGTLLRGFTLGTNKDLTVNSGLRLQLAGKISEDIEIIAALTDENTPIQPEGNTERLEELDKVFIEIKHKNASGIFGDYNYSTKIGEFGKIDRKLQGVTGKVNIDNYSGSFSFASSRGKFNSMQMSGIDGVQGPYRLRGVENENDIIIIAGSEKVYLDGKILKRGENNDYTIEYANGEVTFMPKILITSLSRIIIDFEYTNRQYERNLIGGNFIANLFSNKLSIQVNALQEGDNKNNPIDLSLSDTDKDVLRSSGDDPLAAGVSGIVRVEGDSLGIYSEIDTLIDGSSVKIYKYSPGSPDADFNVSFSFVGDNNGDYTRESLGKYIYAGPGKGAYLPIRLIPLPERNQLGNIVLNYSPIKELNLNLEIAASNHDGNTFSDIDDDDNSGFARALKIDLLPLELNVFKSQLGTVSASFKERIQDNRFKALDRINEVEFDRNYNISSTSDSKETLRETKLNYKPIEEASLSGQYGLVKKGNDFESERILSTFDLDNYQNINADYNFDLVKTNSLIDNTDWLRQSGSFSYSVWNIQPGFEFRSEEKRNGIGSSDSLLVSSLKYHEYSPFLVFNFFDGLSATAKYSFTKEEAPENGVFVDESKAYAHTYSLNYRSIKEFTSSIDFSHRKKKYSELYKTKGFGNNESIQIRSQNQLRLFDRFIEGTLFYQTASERSAKLERVFIRVPQGTGGYSYAGDLNENGIAEENEFVPDPFEGDFVLTTIPTDELFPVIDLKLNTRWKIEFKNYFKGDDFFTDFFKILSTETNYRIEEKSRIAETEKIYLLNLKYFLNDSTTIRGFNYFQQDLHFWKNDRDLSFRFRFTERKSLNQFSSGTENSYLKERSLRMKFRMIKEINNETEYINQIENVLAPENSNRSRNTISNKIVSNFSYRPYNNFELGFGISVGRLEDSFPNNPTIIDENKLTLRFTLSLLSKGRLRVEAERTELLTNTSSNIIPFEITNGNLIGKNYIWRANFDYRFSANLQSNLNYIGRLQGKGKVVNTLTAEARAYF